MSERLRNIIATALTGLMWAYLTGFALAVPYFNWTYAKTNGFGKWLFFGEVIATFRAAAWPYHLLVESFGPEPHIRGEKARLTRQEVRQLLRQGVEHANREITSAPFSVEDCPSLEHSEACLELFRIELDPADLQVNRHYKVHFGTLDLDQSVEARDAWATLVGGDSTSMGFYEEREQICTGETLALMKDHGVRIGIFHHTPGGTLVTSGIVDLKACRDFLELSNE